MKATKLLALFVALLMVGCGEEEQVAQVQAKDDPSIPMAIPCEVCKKEISKKSTSCPNCGHPTPASVVAYKKAQELSQAKAREEQRLLDEKRKQAEEWIRSSTPKEYSRNFQAEERFRQALARLEDGLVANNALDLESAAIAQANLIEELQAKFKLTVTKEEIQMLAHWRDFSQGGNYLEFLSKILGRLHHTGVIKSPTADQKFISEANATARIDSMMEDFVDSLVVISGISEGLRLNLDPKELEKDYPELARYLRGLHVDVENDEPFPEEGLVLRDLIESSDENASLAAGHFRDKLVSVFSAFARKGIFLRTIDVAATREAQRRAIEAIDF